ncbi:hypothetical protein ACFC1T_09045 [Kitasatospora sp. NPDC056076]|uniref:hypothetical protein n=1 Tax=Kitasatospora sp. NPDC056076 TaxID=3345703 RepID=UPI0035DBCCDA
MVARVIKLATSSEQTLGILRRTSYLNRQQPLMEIPRMKIADRLGVDVRTVERALEELQSVALITWTRCSWSGACPYPSADHKPDRIELDWNQVGEYDRQQAVVRMEQDARRRERDRERDEQRRSEGVSAAA